MITSVIELLGEHQVTDAHPFSAHKQFSEFPACFIFEIGIQIREGILGVDADRTLANRESVFAGNIEYPWGYFGVACYGHTDLVHGFTSVENE